MSFTFESFVFLHFIFELFVFEVVNMTVQRESETSTTRKGKGSFAPGESDQV